MNGEIFKALMSEAAKVFGPVHTWDEATKRDVAAWTKRTVDGIQGPVADHVKAEPQRNWYEPEPVEPTVISQWDEFGKL
jgi:hypothetical protein